MSATHRETATGFTCTGDWLDIVEHGEHISCALLELDVIRSNTTDSGDTDDTDDTGDTDDTDDTASTAIDAWERWRPKAHERLRGDVAVRTATHTSGRIRDEDPRWRRFLRRVERFLYLHVMTLVSPCYFDTALIHASVSRVGPLRGDYERQYRLDIVIADDDLRDRMRTLVHEYETLVPRWHIAAAKTTDTVVAAEGHDLSAGEEDDADAPLHPEVNLSQVRRGHAADD